MMELDIRFTSRKDIVCPHCNKVVGTEDVQSENSGGRVWCEILTLLGYYTPDDLVDEEGDWYATDMALTDEQAKLVYDFARKSKDAYNIRWKHEAYILGWSSDHANFEIDGKEYCLVLKEVREGEHWSLKKEEANENESCT